MSELRDLYQEVILDHGRHPRNFGKPAGADLVAEGHNPLCGDKVRVHVKMKDDVLDEIGFEGTGCAISTAAASMMTEALKGKTKEEAAELFQAFHDMVTGRRRPRDGALGKLAAFSTVCAYPLRVKCATLVWHTLLAALRGEKKTATTE